MGVANLIKNVGILTSHISDYDISLIDLVKDPFEYPLGKHLLIDSLGISPHVLSSAFYAKLVDISKVLFKWHENEYERRRSRRLWLLCCHFTGLRVNSILELSDANRVYHGNEHLAIHP